MTKKKDQEIQAKVLACIAHEGQKRKFTGKPYIMHPEAVVNILKKAGENDKRLIAAAYLHDVFEDTDVKEEDFKKAGIVEEVIEAVKELTRPVYETYFDYIMRIKIGITGIIKIKLADLEHNSSDVPEGNLKEKYRFAEYILTKELQKRMKKR